MAQDALITAQKVWPDQADLACQEMCGLMYQTHQAAGWLRRGCAMICAQKTPQGRNQ